MKQRTNIVISVISLFTGGILYVLFRENTHIGRLFSQVPFLKSLRTSLQPLASDPVKFHLPDFLWCLSFGCGLQAILCLRKKKVLFCGFGAFLCGVVWEYMQFFGAVSGTSDYWDVVSYLLAGMFCTIINLKETEK